jgi:hypothetical protein
VERLKKITQPSLLNVKGKKKPYLRAKVKEETMLHKLKKKSRSRILTKIFINWKRLG